MRQLVDEHHVIRHPPLGGLALVELEQVLARDARAGLLDGDYDRTLVPFRVANANDGGLDDVGVRNRDVLEVDGADPFAAGLDDVLGAIGNLHVAVGVDGRDVTGREPAVLQRIAALALEVRIGGPWPLHQQVAKGLAVIGQGLAIGIDDLHVDTEDHTTLLGLHRILRLLVGIDVLGLERGDRAERAHLGHAPGVQHLDAEILLERPDHRGRAGRTADHRGAQRGELQLGFLHVIEQSQPDRGHTRAHRDLFVLEHLVQALAVEVLAGEDELRPGERAAVRQAPRVDVEHRHHREDAVGRREVERIRQGGGVGVQHRTAMAVEDALGIARRSRGVAQARGGLFVEGRPLELVVFGLDQVLVAEDVGQGGLGHVRTVGHDHDVLDRLQAGGDLFHQWHESQVDEQDLVLGMVGDVDHLLREEARVDRVDHRAGAGHRVIDLEMPVAVPGQRGDAVLHADPELGQGLGQAPGPRMGIPVGIAVEIALHPLGHDFRVAVVPVGVADEVADQQRHVHH